MRMVPAFYLQLSNYAFIIISGWGEKAVYVTILADTFYLASVKQCISIYLKEYNSTRYNQRGQQQYV